MIFRRFKKGVLSGWLLIILVVALCASGYAQPLEPQDTVFQVSTLSSLLRGLYDGVVTCGELKQRGNLGIGTFEALDGEMILLDGKIFQVKADGKVLPINDKVKTPFAAITSFIPDESIPLGNIDTFEAVQQVLDTRLTNRNIFYAFRIDGTFSYVKTRSVPRQEKPYPPLLQVTKNQPVFEMHDIKGTLLGFWCPPYVQGINVPGFHLHFISDDRQKGGHVIDFRLAEGTAQIQKLPNFHLLLPDNALFRTVDLSKDWRPEINKAEK